jgi:hypothetical protein
MAKSSSSSSATINLGGLGAAWAAALSYCKWHSLWLAVGHSLLGWIYVFYHLITYGFPIIHRY